MNRQPRARDDVILSLPRLARIVASAVVITIGTLAIYIAFRDGNREEALTMAFSSFVFFQLVNSFCVRSGDETVFSRYSLSNRPLLYALAGVVAMQIIVVELPFMQNIFETVSLDLSQWGWVIVTPLSLLIVDELRKVVVRARRGPLTPSAELAAQA
jgi:Ca2+-transporting ATPase